MPNITTNYAITYTKSTWCLSRARVYATIYFSLLKCPNILTSVRPQIPLHSDSYHFLNLKFLTK